VIPPIITIRISPEAPTLQVGEAVQLKVTAFNVSTSEGFLWRTSDDKVARVSASGLVAAIGAGRATISVKPVADTMAGGWTEVIVK
jgi:arabinogalactan endo-1,4-beta-galactosidase